MMKKRPRHECQRDIDQPITSWPFLPVIVERLLSNYARFAD